MPKQIGYNHVAFHHIWKHFLIFFHLHFRRCNIFLTILFPPGKPEVDLVTPTPHTNPTQPPGIPDFCSLEKLDAMVMTKDKKTYAFSGAFFTEVSDKGAGKVKKIKDHWPGLEDGIDAAVTRRHNGWTYFFKGTK